jgi:hypothetical protein
MFCKNEDLSGMKFGRWTATTLAQAGTTRLWNCICECGTKRPVNAQRLKNGTSKSCGCLQKELVAARSKTHGHSRKDGYSNWMEMKDRCYNEDSPCYKYYGAVGVYVADDVMDYEDFIKAIGPKPSKDHSVGRLDNSKPYCADNIRWETKAQQARNRTMISSNTSGITGVYLDKNVVDGVVYGRWVAKYTDLTGKQVKKSFSVLKYGYEEAFALAVDFRNNGIRLLQELGADYGAKHGMKREKIE